MLPSDFLSIDYVKRQIYRYDQLVLVGKEKIEHLCMVLSSTKFPFEKINDSLISIQLFGETVFIGVSISSALSGGSINAYRKLQSEKGTTDETFFKMGFDRSGSFINDTIENPYPQFIRDVADQLVTDFKDKGISFTG